MKGLILAGGFGTRLRPLTFTVPKPVVDFCNKEMLLHQIEALIKVGVTEVVLAVNYLPPQLIEAIREFEKTLKIRISFSEETEPMGTGGPLALARSILEADGDPFFVLNSDVICDFPFAQLLAFHREHGKEGTILVTKVKDPSKYGVVVHDATGKIERFVEKPVEYVGDEINAGLYVFSPAILRRIENRPTSIERETFPAMAAANELYCMPLPGFWMDIGQPPDYLSGQVLYLDCLKRKGSAELAVEVQGGPTIRGNVLIHPSATVAAGAVLGPDVVIGAGCRVEAGARIKRTAILSKTTVKQGAFLDSSIIGWKSSVGAWARLENSYLGEDVAVGDETQLNGTVVCPHKSVKENLRTPGTIVL